MDEGVGGRVRYNTDCVILSQLIIRYVMSGSKLDLADIFGKIDTDHDNLISRADLQHSSYAVELFGNSQKSLKVFDHAHDGKINLTDFQLLYYAHTLSKPVPAVLDAVIAKFEAAKFLDKYLSVSAPGAVHAALKQSYLRLLASSEEAAAKHQHSIGIQLGVDKPVQQTKIQQVTKVIGHNLHEVFLLLKFKFKSAAKGEAFAKKLQSLLGQFIDLIKQLAGELQQLFALLKIIARYRDGYIYLVVEIDHPFVDGIISFLNQVIQSLSPKPTLKFKARLVSTLKDLLKETFDYKSSSGQILIEFDVDSWTLHKLKTILSESVLNQNETSHNGILFGLLFEQLRLSAEFSNLGEALSSTLNEEASSFPKPYDYVHTIKSFEIKQTLNQLSQGFFAEFINDLQENGEFEGELSVNFRDIYLRLDFNLDIEQAFDLL